MAILTAKLEDNQADLENALRVPRRGLPALSMTRSGRSAQSAPQIARDLAR